MDDNLYPPSVQNAPPDLTIPSKAYRRQVVTVLASLIVFAILYLSLTLSSAWAILYGISQGVTAQPNEYGKSDSSGYYGMAFLGAILFLFLVKGLFKWREAKDDLHIEITEAEHPKLFEFIRKVCEETKAPLPYRVFVSPEVNAAVFYNNSLLSLVLPVKKNLLIGLGLVNSLNLSEFKATLAHEFGHFSQDAMRVGSYVYMANHIIYDMVYQRDAFDELLSSAKRSDARIAILAYIIYAMLWVLRKIMQGAFRLINFFQSALSRQMEFHADLVAVSITGSDSIVHTLKKLSPANSCLHQVFHDLKGASERHLYTQDIYYHHHRALEQLRSIESAAEAVAIPEANQPPRLFSKGEEEDSDTMWASHPSHYDREQNAKHHYIPSITDERSPWLLFRNPEMLRQRVTERFYQKVLEMHNVTLVPVEQVQKFIDDEHSETTQDARYLGLYDGRLLAIPAEVLTSSANDPVLATLEPERIEALLNKLYNAEYKNWLEEHLKHRDELHTLVALVQGEVRLKGNHFEFRGEKRSKSELNTTLQQVDNEVAEGEDWLKEFDNEVFLVHLRMAQIVQEGDYDLYARYYFQLNLQDILKTAYAEEARLAATYQFVSSKEALSKDEFQQVVTALNVAHRSISVAYEKARAVALPALQNMQEGIALSEILLPLGLLPPHQEGQSELNQQWANTLVEQILEIKEKGSRLYFKSMGAILSRQEAIARKYRERDGITLP